MNMNEANEAIFLQRRMKKTIAPETMFFFINYLENASL